MIKKHKIFLIYLGLYGLVSLLFLTVFPFVHSDEPWLSGLSRNMAESGSISVTETFFDLKPRAPHAIKTLFHLMQIAAMAVGGYTVATFRFLSLLFGLLSLGLFYHIVHKATGSARISLLAAALLSVDVQFVYVSHFARQEIVILFCMLAVYALLASGHRRSALFAALVTGASIGIHPNSFLVAALGGAVLLAQCLIGRRMQWRRIFTFIGVVGAFALVVVAVNLSMNANFFRDYTAYGSEFEIDSPLTSKLFETGPYFMRLFNRTSGTYYTPDIRFQLLLFAGLLAFSIGVAAIRKDVRLLPPLAAIAGIWAGMALVGRFNQPYVVFFFAFCYLLLAVLVCRLRGWRPIALLGCCALLVCGLSAKEIIPVATQPRQYADYLADIAAAVPSSAKTIGNLNAEYHFKNGALLDYRNLPYLKERGLSLSDYVRQNSIEYLIISDELRLIYELRPNWNGIYGNINFLDELDAFLEAHCTLMHSFVDDQYGVRVVRFMNDTARDFTVRIYRVN